MLTWGAVPLSRLFASVLYTNVMVRKCTVIFIMYIHAVQCCHLIGWSLTLDRGEYTSGFLLHRLEQQHSYSGNSSCRSTQSSSSGSSRNSSKEPHSWEPHASVWFYLHDQYVYSNAFSLRRDSQPRRHMFQFHKLSY